MKTLCVTILLALSSASFGQSDSLSINLRLDMAGQELHRAGELDELANWMLVGAVLFAASDRINNRDGNPGFATGVLAFGATAHFSIRAAGDRHRRKAAQHLHRQ